jgi:phosphoglycolate phosphatase-like HAD superfamily hydrolase
MERRLLLFDIDGTLLLCRGRGMRAMHRAIQRLFGAAPVPAQILPMGKTDPVLFEEAGAAYGIDAHEIRGRSAELHATYLEALAEELADPGACEAKPGVERLVTALAARTDVTLGLVSGNLERAAWLKLAAVGLDGYFAGGAFGSDGRRRGDLVRLALSRFATLQGRAIDPAHVWVIGDTPDDVAGGREQGTRTLAVATGGFARPELECCGPDAVLDTFEDTLHAVDILCGAG